MSPQPQSEPNPADKARLYNPASVESPETRTFACRWELLRRHAEFRKDAELWVATWHERKRLLKVWARMSLAERNSARGIENKGQRVRCSDILFTMKHSGLPIGTTDPVPLQGSSSEDRNGDIRLADQEIEQLRHCRGWQRADFILCALRWLLPPTLYKRPRRADKQNGHSGRPEEYAPEMPANLLKHHRRYGPLLLSQAWPDTPESFRKEFVRACTPGWRDEKFQEIDFHPWALELLRISNLIHPGDDRFPASTPEQLCQAKAQINAFAIGCLAMLKSRYRCFLIPAGRVYARGELRRILNQIEEKFPTFRESIYRKAAFLGRSNQWEAFLIAESLPPKNGHFDYYGAAKILARTRHNASEQWQKLSRFGKQGQNDVKDLCQAIEHWISCIYPAFQPRPYVSRKSQKKLGGKS